MKKPTKECELKLSAEDVKEAIDLWLNKNQISPYVDVKSIHKTRSRKYFAVVKFK